MQVAKDKVVSFHYILKEDQGMELENSHGDDPVAYLHGYRNILPALEQELAGHKQGDKISVTLAPERAYGLRKEDAVTRVAKKHLLTKGRVVAGMTVKVNASQGPRDAVVVKVGKFNVDVDSNHPMAGKTLNFEIEIIDIREATAEEKAHGHAHGVGGHHH